MRVLADFHHQALYHSLYLLFEKRLGWELYRPIGKEWWEQGFWKVYDHPHTAEQFLGLHQGTEVPMDVHGQPLPETERKNLHYKVEDGVYYIQDLTYGTTHRALRLEKFKNMEFDILLSSIPQHINPFNQLIASYQKNAKHIFQIGNSWSHVPGVNNILASCSLNGLNINHNQHVVFYHQEFDLEVFKYVSPKFHNIVNSYVHYMKNPQHMIDTVSKLPGWTATTYGAGMQLQLQSADAVATALKNSAFTWHNKPEGDGFGHVIHSSYACGRPAVYWGSQYKGKAAGDLLEHGVTGIDAEQIPLSSLHLELQKYAQPDTHKKMCENAFNRFREVVDFDMEFERIKLFLEHLR